MKDKESYYQNICHIRKLLKEDTGPACTCPKHACDWHGDCEKCVRQHRLVGDHLPVCLQPLLAESVKRLTDVMEWDTEHRPFTPPEYWDYVHKRDAGASPTSL